MELVGLVLTVIGGTAAALARATETPTADHRQVGPFDLWQVRLLDGPFREAMERNRQYLRSLDNDRQSHTFRLTAGLPSHVKPLGGWEHPDNGARGEFFGHSLSAYFAKTWHRDLHVEYGGLNEALLNLYAWIRPVAGKSLEFRIYGQRTDVTLVPLARLFGECYAVYWDVYRKGSPEHRRRLAGQQR
jgi:hypothetical protein